MPQNQPFWTPARTNRVYVTAVSARSCWKRPQTTWRTSVNHSVLYADLFVFGEAGRPAKKKKKKRKSARVSFKLPMSAVDERLRLLPPRMEM